QPVQDVNLAGYDLRRGRRGRQNRPPHWAELDSSRRASLRRLVCEMAVGDVIYVKDGPKIVGKGIVEEDYRFDRVGIIPGALGTRWRHQRKVKWLRSFREVT